MKTVFIFVLSAILALSCENNDGSAGFIKNLDETIRETVADNLKPLIDERIKSVLDDFRAELQNAQANKAADLSEYLTKDEINTLIQEEIGKAIKANTENLENSLIQNLEEKIADATRELKEQIQNLSSGLETSEEARKKLEKSLIDKFEAKIAEAIKQLKEQIEKLSKNQEAPEKKNTSTELRITVAENNFGNVSTTEVQKVLYSAASELWKYFPKHEIPAIYVIYSASGPMVWYKKNERNEIVVQLSAKDRFYAQYAYQFAHEFCHILCNYADDKSQENKWFEESICECASLFAVKAMAESWKTNPPYPNWKPYAESLKGYFDNITKEPERYLPRRATLKKWFAENEEQLRKNPVQRDLNKKVAQMLFEKLDKKPENWEAVKFLNQGEKDKDNTFANYLQRWLDNADKKFHKFITEISDEFGIKLKK